MDEHGRNLDKPSTLFLCRPCLDEEDPSLGIEVYDPTIIRWVEAPLETCSICGDVDLQSREEMDAYHHDMSNLQWEEEQQMDVFEPIDPQELK